MSAKKYGLDFLFETPVLDLGIRYNRQQRQAFIESYGPVFFYDIRHDDECQGEWCQVQEFVMVNHWTTIISKDPIDAPADIDEEEDVVFTDQFITVEDYMSGNFNKEIPEKKDPEELNAPYIKDVFHLSNILWDTEDDELPGSLDVTMQELYDEMGVVFVYEDKGSMKDRLMDYLDEKYGDYGYCENLDYIHEHAEE